MRDDTWLRRRVLLTGALTLGAFFTITAAIEATDRPQWLALALLAAFLLLVTLPLMRPVMDELRQRKGR